MFFIKGGSILINFLLVPLTINYVDVETYGLWLTLSSMVGWFSFFDIGINNSLRNKFAEAIANNNKQLARKYVSTTYAILSIIFASFFIVFYGINHFIKWQNVLHLTTSQDISLVLIIIVAYFCLKFVLSSINIILIADQRPAESALRILFENILALLIIFILTRYTSGSLLKLCLGLTVSPLIILAVFNFKLFSKRYKYCSPSVHFVDFKLTRNLLSMGVKFFVIQISSILYTQTISFIIMRYYSSTAVTQVNIAGKYFYIILMLFNIIIGPMWSASTDAYARNDIQWIRNVVRRYEKVFYFIFALAVLMLISSQFVYRIWIGKDIIHIPFKLSVVIMLQTLVLTYGGLYIQVLNGMGYLKIQFWGSVIAPLIFFTLVWFVIKFTAYEATGIIIASIISNYCCYLLGPMQYRMVMKNKRGIWVK